MREVSETVEALLTGSREVSAYLSVYYDGEPVFDYLPISEGSLSVDSTQAVQASLEVTVPRFATDTTGTEVDMLPTKPGPSLNCEGTQVALSYQIGLPGEEREVVDLGWYRISDWEQGEGTIAITALSLEDILQEARFLNTQNVGKGASYTNVFRRFVGDLLPLDISADDATITEGEAYEEDRLATLVALATAWPARMYVDDAGVLNVAPPYDDKRDPVVAVLTDGEDGTVVKAPTSGNREGIYNAVKATGEADGNVAPVSATVYLREGPRRWNGPYGNVPLFYSSPFIKTKAAARRAATTRLNNVQVKAAPVDLECAPDPRYQVGDLIELHTADEKRIVRIAALELPVTYAGTMTITGTEVTR